MEIVLITASFFVAALIIGKGWRLAGLAALYLIMVGAALHFQNESEKVFIVTVKGETFKAKNVIRGNGWVHGVRLDTGKEFVAAD